MDSGFFKDASGILGSFIQDSLAILLGFFGDRFFSTFSGDSFRDSFWDSFRDSFRDSSEILAALVVRRASIPHFCFHLPFPSFLSTPTAPPPPRPTPTLLFVPSPPLKIVNDCRRWRITKDFPRNPPARFFISPAEGERDTSSSSFTSSSSSSPFKRHRLTGCYDPTPSSLPTA